MTHINYCDVRTDRRWSPVYTFGGDRYDTGPIPPMTVTVNVEFDDNDAALEFERKVRDILEEM